MSAKTNKLLSVGKALTYLLLLLLAAGVIGFVAVFTNGFTDDFKTFYIQHNDAVIVQTESKLSLRYDTALRFDCKYTFDNFKKNAEPKGYDVKIVPNATEETDFEFTADGEPHLYSDEKDLTKAFDIHRYDGYFTVTVPLKFGMRDVLGKLYEGKTVAIPESAEENGYFYTLEISSYNGKANYSIDFNFYYEVERIELDKEEITL